MLLVTPTGNKRDDLCFEKMLVMLDVTLKLYIAINGNNKNKNNIGIQF